MHLRMGFIRWCTAIEFTHQTFTLSVITFCQRSPHLKIQVLFLKTYVAREPVFVHIPKNQLESGLKIIDALLEVGRGVRLEGP